MTQLVAVISGTSRGLGGVMAGYLLDKGWKVFGCARSEADIEHPNYRHTVLDISDSGRVNEFFRDLRKQTEHIDALVNNAGIASMNAFALSPLESSQRIFDVNVHGTIQFCQKALGLLRKAPYPRIVNMTTVAVPLLLEGEAIYAASKSAVETLTKIIAKEYGPFGITCNAIGPSPIKTNLIRGVPENAIARLIDRQAIKSMAKPEDVTNILAFFLQPESSMITGQVLYLGGITK